MREVELRLDFVTIARGSASRSRLVLGLGNGAKVVPDFLDLIRLDFAGVALLIGNSDFRKRLDYLLRGDLQFSG